MKFSFLTLFPEIIKPYFESSILKNALQNNLISYETINIRDFACNKHKKVDNTLISGGAGMLLSPEIVDKAISSLDNARVIFLSPVGARFTQKDARRLSKYSHIAFVCGRYEGFDERNIEINADEIFSIGDFIITGGELGALCMMDSISRQVEGVLGNQDSLMFESFESNLLEAPNFTKPLEKLDKKFDKFAPPISFLNGNHARISGLKLTLSKIKTKYFRVDLYQNIKGKL